MSVSKREDLVAMAVGNSEQDTVVNTFLLMEECHERNAYGHGTKGDT